MSWGVDDIDLLIFIKNSGILGKDGDSALTLDIIGVHDTLFHFLVRTEYAALL